MRWLRRMWRRFHCFLHADSCSFCEASRPWNMEGKK